MSSDIILKNFEGKINLKEKKKLLQHLRNINYTNRPRFFESFKKNYKYSYDKNFIKKYKRFKNINIIGMGGSSLGAKAICNFFKNRIKKKITFSENLDLKKKKTINRLNIIVSKSGNTIETIANVNLFVKKKDQ